MLNIIIGISIAILLFCYYLTWKTRSVKAKIGVFIASGLIFICALTLICRLFFPGNPITRELFLLRVSAKKMGEYLSSSVPDTQTLVLTDIKLTPDSIKGKELLKGLKEGLGSKIEIKAVEVLGKATPYNDPDNFNLRNNLIEPTFEDFDLMIKKYPDCSLIIFLSGLPPGFASMELWEQEKIPKIAVINTNLKHLKQAITAKIIIAVVSYKPNLMKIIKNDSMTEENFSKAFEIITPENINQQPNNSKKSRKKRRYFKKTKRNRK